MTATTTTTKPRKLSPQAARAHDALISVLGGDTVVPVPLVAALFDGDHDTAGTVLADLAATGHATKLATASTRAGEEVYRIVRGSGPQHAITESSLRNSDTRDAREKIIAWYAARAAGAAVATNSRAWLADPAHAWHTQTRVFDSDTTALAWFDTHREHLRVLLWNATEHQLTDLAWRFAEVLAHLALSARRHHDALEFADLGLRVLTAEGSTPRFDADTTACAALHARRVVALTALKRHADARSAAKPVKRYAKTTSGEHRAVSAAWTVVADAAHAAGRPDRALAYRVKALDAALASGDRELLSAHISRIREAMEALLGPNSSAVTSLINAHLHLVDVSMRTGTAGKPGQDATTVAAPAEE